MAQPPSPALVTKRPILAHVLVCLGCCCGRTDRGKPPVPVDWLKAEWKRRRLHRRVHLSISGCLGPCDLTNVVGVITRDRQTWLGNLSTQTQYEDLLAWAAASAEAERALALPAALQPHIFDRF